MTKKFKYLLLLIIVYFLTGCSVNYNLSFIDDKLEEKISTTLIGTDYQEGSITTLKDYKLLAISRGLEQIEYKKQYKDDGKSFQINYNYTYTLNNFNKNNIISNCYDAFSFTTVDNYYLLSTSKYFKCMSVTDYQMVDSYKIVINTNHKVLDSNADEVKGNTYIWNIYNEGNETSVEKPITIKFSKEKVAGPLVTNWPLLIISLLTVVLIGGILLVVVNKKNAKDK